MLQNQDDARDVVHGLFVDLVGDSTGLARSRAAGAELAYLYRAVTRRCLNLLRDAGNRQRLLDQHEVALRGPARTRIDDRVVDVDLLARLVDELDERSLEVLVCHWIDDMSQQEVADHLGISRKTVGKRLARIRAHVSALDAPAEGEA